MEHISWSSVWRGQTDGRQCNVTQSGMILNTEKREKMEKKNNSKKKDIAVQMVF